MHWRAENGALDPWSLNLRFWGAPIFSPEASKPLFWRVSERFGANIWGAPNADTTTTDPTPHSRPSECTELLRLRDALQCYCDVDSRQSSSNQDPIRGPKNQTKIPKDQNRDPRNHDSQRLDKILRMFLGPEIGQFSAHFGALSIPHCTENLEKSTGENLKNPVETASQNCGFLSLVVVERVLTKRRRVFFFFRANFCHLPCDTSQYFGWSFAGGFSFFDPVPSDTKWLWNIEEHSMDRCWCRPRFRTFGGH